MRRRWRDLEWIERFGYTVMAGFAVVIAALVLALVLNDGDNGPQMPPQRSVAASGPQHRP